MAVYKEPLFTSVLQEEAKRALEDIVKAVQQGGCNLFLGSGVHAPPPAEDPRSESLKGKLPPVGPWLSKTLAEQCAYAERFPNDDAGDLQRVSQYFESQKGRHLLVESVRREVENGKEPSPILLGLAQLNFPLVVTTNYDTLFQRALGLAGKLPCVTSVYHSNENGAPYRTDDTDKPLSGSKPFVFKMHGDIESGESLVITEEDYIQFILRFRDLEPYHLIPNKVLEQIKRAPTLFIGYSLKDYNLRVWLKMLRRMVDVANFPDNYSVDLKPDPIIWDVWCSQRRYINFVAQDVWRFVPELFLRLTGKELVV
jgi:hypothetical protein